MLSKCSSEEGFPSVDGASVIFDSRSGDSMVSIIGRSAVITYSDISLVPPDSSTLVASVLGYHGIRDGMLDFFAKHLDCSKHAFIKELPTLFDFVTDPSGKFVFARPRLGLWIYAGAHAVRLGFGGPFESPKVRYGSSHDLVDAINALVQMIIDGYDITLVGDRVMAMDGLDYNVREFILHRGDGNTLYLDPKGDVIEFGGVKFVLNPHGVRNSDIALAQLEDYMAAGGRDDSPGEVMRWVIGALGSLRPGTYRTATRISESIRGSLNYKDPFFFGGCLSESDMEDGMLIYTRRWDNAPIVVLKSEFLAKYVSRAHGISIRNAEFLACRFRTVTTMDDGITHIYAKGVVLDKGRWWVWAPRAVGWFACVPPPPELRGEALSSGQFDVVLCDKLEFVAINDFDRSGLDAKAEVLAGFGTVSEMDPFAGEVIVWDCSAGAGYPTSSLLSGTESIDGCSVGFGCGVEIPTFDFKDIYQLDCVEITHGLFGSLLVGGCDVAAGLGIDLSLD